jgi:hypothetical protein
MAAGGADAAPSAVSPPLASAGGNTSARSPATTGAVATATPAAAVQQAPAPPYFVGTNAGLDDDDEATVVSQVPSEILGQLAGDRITGRPPAIEDEAAEWRRVFDEFVKLKKECNEPVDGISFEKFKNTLRKNRDQLLQRHGCKSVKFSVYVKQGKAALKANPVRT